MCVSDKKMPLQLDNKKKCAQKDKENMLFGSICLSRFELTLLVCSNFARYSWK